MRFGQRLALAGAALGVDDVEALAPALDELGDQLGRVLEVAVDHDDGVAARRLQPGDRRHRLAEAPREAQHLDARVALAQRQDQLLGAVGRGIDAEDQLPRSSEAVEHARRRLVYTRSIFASSL